MEPEEAQVPQVLDWWSKFFASLHYAEEQQREQQTTQHHSVDLLTTASLMDHGLGNGTTGLWKAKRAALAHKNKRRLRSTVTGYASIARLVVYSTELEAVGEFGGFEDVISTYPLYRGVASPSARPDERLVGKFKGKIRICRYNGAGGELPEDLRCDGLFPCLPLNEMMQRGLVEVLVRVYVVQADNLHPADSNGKADPYLYITLGKDRRNDRDNYISKQLNPVFGKMFEFMAVFPQESKMTIAVKDWDLVSADDLIGETEIDLESRFYSHHRAFCGLAESYSTSGYNEWRDFLRPSAILEHHCKKSKMAAPVYTLPSHVRVGGKLFLASKGRGRSREWAASKEDLALDVLRRWREVPGSGGVSFVPEHVETRALYNSAHPGLVMGRLRLWVDMFPLTMRAPPPVDISPRKPKGYELRLIIWNTEDVVLDDEVLLTGEKMSDIYVKGWVHSADVSQSTDVHYRSLTGEGNFNFRFVFPFQFLEAEERIVWARKETRFSIDKTQASPLLSYRSSSKVSLWCLESRCPFSFIKKRRHIQEKLPPVLELQVWDADYVMPDDFLGSLKLRLTDFPRGSKTAAQCSVDLLSSSQSRVSMWQQRRIKGWWPFVNPREGGAELTGKVEMELELLTEEEAAASPVGLGRSEPSPLPLPSRPDDSFMWLTNPLKSMRFVIWRNHKWLILQIIAFVLFLLLFILFVYSVPGYVAKRVVGA